MEIITGVEVQRLPLTYNRSLTVAAQLELPASAAAPLQSRARQQAVALSLQ